jgi:hypothetical protein
MKTPTQFTITAKDKLKMKRIPMAPGGRVHDDKRQEEKPLRKQKHKKVIRGEEL